MVHQSKATIVRSFLIRDLELERMICLEEGTSRESRWLCLIVNFNFVYIFEKRYIFLSKNIFGKEKKSYNQKKKIINYARNAHVYCDIRYETYHCS